MNRNRKILEVHDDSSFVAVKEGTGEIVEGTYQPIEYGSKVITPEQLQAQRDYAIRKRELNDLHNALKEFGGKFFWANGAEQFKDIDPATVVRLFYLLTYLQYDDYSLRISKSKEPFKKSQLAKILGVSKRTADYFWKEVSPKYLIECDGYIFAVKNNIFIRGELSRDEIQIKLDYFRIYCLGVRELYKACLPSDHKRLGYIFQILPYINREYNIICHNPYETDINQIKPMNIREFCELIGYSIANANKLFQTYKEIRFRVDDHTERFVSVVYDGLNKMTGKLIINPRILYHGSDYNKVEVLGLFYK